MTHHVVVRGVERRTIFLDDEDRTDFLERLDRIVPESGAACLAWALIPNHFHLVVRRGAIPLSRVMSRLGTGYARRFNERHARVGHLFQSRYLSRPVADDADLLGLIRYVHLNPLRHGIVGSLQALDSYAWCGHAALIGIAAPRRFHAAEAALELFAATRAAARRELRAWMAQPLDSGARLVDAETRDDPDFGPALAARASPDDEPADAVGDLDAIARLAARLAAVPERELRGASKRPAAVRARALVCFLGTTRLALPRSRVARSLAVSERAVARGAALGASIAGSGDPIAAALLAELEESPDRRDCPRQ